MIDKLGKMKDLYALKRRADLMKKQMEAVTITVREGDLELTMRGDQIVESVSEGGEEREDLKKLFNKGVKESQKKIAKKMRGQFGDLGLLGL